MGLVIDLFLPLALAFIMFALGIGLTLEDFYRVARQPRDFLIGAMSQMLVLPLVALGLVSLWPMPPELAVGLMIIAAAPGGVTSNILTAFARGDVALSISLTAITSLLSVITIPIIATASYAYLIGESAQQNISIAGTALSVFAIATLPVLIGLGVRHYATGYALRVEPVARHLSTLLFIIVLAGAIFQERTNITAYFAQAGLITLTLNLVMMLIAFTLAYVFATGPRQRVAIALECGLQNGTLAIAVATLMFGGGLVTVPAATYSLIMFGTGLIFVGVLRRHAQAHDQAHGHSPSQV